MGAIEALLSQHLMRSWGSTRGINSYKTPNPSMTITESFTLMFIWTFHRRNTGKLANVQSVKIDTAATANDNAVCISRG